MTITFKANGVPQTKGSAKAFFRPGMKHAVITNDNKKCKPWQAGVSQAAAEAFSNHSLFMGPVQLELRFIMPRPKAHFRTGKHANELKPNAPKWHDKKPDADKLIRAVKDGLSKIVYHDDAQVAFVVASKEYDSGEGVGVEVAVKPLA